MWRISWRGLCAAFPEDLDIDDFSFTRIAEDEVIEITPNSIRVRKKILDASKRNSERKRAKAGDALPQL